VHRAKQFHLDHNGMVSPAWFQVFAAKLSVRDSGVFCAFTFSGFRFFHSLMHSLALSLFLFKVAAEVAGMIHSDFGSF